MKMTRCWKSTVLPAVVLSGILLAATLAGCGGSAVTGDGTTAVTVTVGEAGSAPATASSRAMPRPLGAAIPPTVTDIRFTISGAGIGDIVQTFAVTGATMAVTLQVPSGPARTILVEALDSGGISRFRGTAVIDAVGVALAVTIDMAIDPSNPALRTWTVVDNTASSTLTRIVQGDGILLAGGMGREILSSLDGISWTSHASQFFPGNIDGLAFGDNTFLAMASNLSGTSFPGTWTTHFFGATSDNVNNWTARGTIDNVNAPFADLAFGDGIFVAVGENNAFYSQDNGANWFSGTISGVSYLAGVAYGNGRFVAPDALSDNVAVSTDGIAWTTVAVGLIPPDANRRIGFGGGLFLLTTSFGDVYTSADGVSWLQRTRFADIAGLDTTVVRIVYGAGGFLIVTQSPTQLFFSFDSGTAWAAVDPGVSVPGLSAYDGTYFNSRFLLVGFDGGSGLGGVFRSGEP